MRTFFNRYVELQKMFQLILIIISCFMTLGVSQPIHAQVGVQTEPLNLKQILNQNCLKSLGQFKSFFKVEVLKEVCEQVQQEEGCQSFEGAPLFHLDHKSKVLNAKKIMVISLIHGDETEAGSLGRFWMERLMKVDARNSWRVLPVANPDGVRLKTRANANGVDLNRNFPTTDWGADAIKFWESEAHKSPRKFPGKVAGEEPEVKCLMKHLSDYKPDFVISIHTPLNVLDFDGPKLKHNPQFSYLPWKSLGNFPGSLGRYLWVERKIPVLTTELKNSLPVSSLPFEQLQDIIGTLVKADLK